MIKSFFQYRLNIPLLIFSICLVAFIPDLSLNALILSLAFSLLGAFIYIFNKATDIEEDAVNLACLPIEAKRRKMVMGISVTCLVLPLFFLVQWPALLGLYVALGLVGYLYSVPLRFMGLRRRLKDVIVIKNAVSAASWGAVPALVPALYQGNDIGFMTFMIWLNYFIFIFAVEVMWDIRDIDGDRAVGIKTIPNVFGVWAAKIICLIPIFILFGYRLIYDTTHPIFLTAYILTIISILWVKKDTHPYFFQSIVMIWIVAHGLFLLQYYL